MSIIYFAPKAMAKLNAYVDHSEGEVSGLGKVKQIGEDFHVREVLLIEQESGYSSTELDDDALAEFLQELVAKGEDPSSWRLWWHSHGSFKVFWSFIDEKTCAKFNNEWMISVVTNQRREYLGRLDLYRPIHLWTELPVRVYVELSEDEIEAIKEELEKKVRRKAWSQLYYRRWFGTTGDRGSWAD
ncbi:TPA: hypothetical protein EYP37_11900, partial [Candidatus Poribacteria bacterium]|nr:hypothetical protein [Candidatus Poribacteria bacterium]